MATSAEVSKALQASDDVFMDPPIAVPIGKKDTHILVRLYVNDKFNGVTEIKLQSGAALIWTLEQSKIYPTLWFVLVPKLKLGNDFCFSLRRKKGFMEKTFSLGRGTKEEILKDQLKRNIKGSISTDIFLPDDIPKIESEKIHVSGLSCFIITTAESIKDKGSLESLVELSQNYREMCIDLDKSSRLSVLNNLLSAFRKLTEEGKLYIVPIMVSLSERILECDMKDLSNFPKAIELIYDTLRIGYRFDKVTQGHLPDFLNTLHIVDIAQKRQKVQTLKGPSVMDLILTCFPSVSEQILSSNAKVFESEEDMGKTARALLHLVTKIDPAFSSPKALFQTVIGKIRPYGALYNISKMVQESAASEMLKQLFKDVAVHHCRNIIKEHFKDVDTTSSTTIIFLRDLCFILNEYDVEFLKEIASEVENVLLESMHMLRERRENAVVDAIKFICSGKCVFTTTETLQALFQSALDTKCHDLFIPVYIEYLNRGLGCNVDDMRDNGIILMETTWESSYYSTNHERIFLLYTTLLQIQLTVYAKQNVPLLHHLHQFVFRHISNISCCELLEAADKIPKEKKDNLQQFIGDFIQLALSKIDLYGVDNLTEWMAYIFGDKDPIALQKGHRDSILLVAESRFLERLKSLEGNDPDRSRVLSAVLKNREFIQRIFKGDGDRAKSIKTHELMQYVMACLKYLANLLESKKIRVSFLTFMNKNNTEWQTQLVSLMWSMSSCFGRIGLFDGKKTERAIKMCVSIQQTNYDNMQVAFSTLCKIQSLDKKPFSLQTCIDAISTAMAHLQKFECYEITVLNVDEEKIPLLLKGIIIACVDFGDLLELPMFWKFLGKDIENYEPETIEKENSHTESEREYAKTKALIEFVAKICLERFLAETKHILMSDYNTKTQEMLEFLGGPFLMEHIDVLQTLTSKSVPQFKKDALQYLKRKDELAELEILLKNLCDILKINISDSIVLGTSLETVQYITEAPLSDLGQFYRTLDHAYKTLHQDIRTLEVLRELTQPKHKQLLEFLPDTGDADLRNLIDAVEEHLDERVNESIVSDFIQVNNYVRPIIRARSVKALLLAFSSSQESETRDIISKINNCSMNFHNLKSLYRNVENRGEMTKYTINSIVKECSVLIKVSVNDCTIKVTYQSNNRTRQLSLEELIDTKSRAYLIANTVPESDTQHFKFFIDIVGLIKDASEKADELCLRGHFDFQEFRYHINDSNYEMVSDSLTALNKKLSLELETWNKDLYEMRERFYSLNFVFSEQIPLLYRFFTIGECKEQAIHILRYISPNGFNSVQRKTLSPNFCHLAQEKLMLVAEQLEHFVTIPYEPLSLPSGKLFQQMTQNVNAIVLEGRPYVAQIANDSNQTIPVLLNLYYNTTKTMPRANQILFCSNETTVEEIQMIINRCLKSRKPYLYIIAFVERLDYSEQNYLVERLNETIDENQGRFLLALLCKGSSNHPFLQRFSQYVNRVQGMNSASMKECFKKIAPNATTVTSTLPGLGKTEYIYESSSKHDLSVRTIHFSGNMTKEMLVERVPNELHAEVYHFDIGQFQDTEALDHFLFELLILKCAVSSTTIAHLNDNGVFVEIANTIQESLRKGLYVISHLDNTTLKWENFADMRISKEICSPIQVVCNYLEASQKQILGSNDLFFTKHKNVHVLPKTKCIRILQREFMRDNEISYPVINVFLGVLAQQLKKLSTSQYFRIQNLKVEAGEQNVGTIRRKMLTVLVRMCKDFAFRSVTTSRSAQKDAVRNEIDADALTKRMEGMLQWEESNHFMVVFNKTSSHTVTPLYCKRSNVDSSILELIESQLKLHLPDFQEYGHTQLQHMLEKIVCSTVIDKIGPSQLQTNYTLTPDNLIKMVQISLRISDRLPVILSGETGCGKTSLVRYLANLCGITFHAINFHAGISEGDIVKNITKFNQEAISQDKEIWVFLDEINTCDHLGIIKDILCHRKCHDLVLSPSLVLLGACNPYRLRNLTQVHTAGLKEKAKLDVFSRLVYRVYPLPESMLDYIWDYGVLHTNDELIYIGQMVKGVCGTDTSGGILDQKLVRIISCSHAFLRKAQDTHTCVSLRDVNRFRLLCKYFDKMLRAKAQNQIIDMSSHNRKIIVLSLAQCYAIRLATAKERESYYKAVAEIMFGYAGDHGDVRDILLQEQKDLLDRMEIPPGIAKNTALLENVFVLFVCIMNKMPIFLVGKPGCSKSLSMQLLKSNLRGMGSNDDFFKKLPELYVFSYQGSESSTSEGILKVFKKAEKYLVRNKDENVLPVVLLDEVGLAEVSSHNPLKVLHSLLEPEGNDFPDFAVVGISNWALDAAKMNRAIHLSRPDLTEDELKKTAISITTQYKQSRIEETLTNVLTNKMLSAVSKAYDKYQTDENNRHFHGLRDFYFLIKYITRQFERASQSLNKIKDEVTLNEEIMKIMKIVHKGLLRNFGGKDGRQVIDTFFERLKTLLSEKENITQELSVSGEDVGLGHLIRTLFPLGEYVGIEDLIQTLSLPKEDISMEDLIQENLNDKLSRHLLVISRGDSVLDIIVNLLKGSSRSFEIMYGSNFENDKCDNYHYRTLSRIIHCMEFGKVLILKDLDDIYGSLYDMLNQNYSMFNETKTCRVALGPYSNPMCPVHHDFKCIVLIEENKLPFSDPPFLNRFEKQHISLMSLLQENERDVVKKLQTWIKLFCTIPDLPFRMQDTLPGFHDDTIPSLVYVISRNLKKLKQDDTQLHEMCKKMLLQMVTPDGIMRLPRSNLKANKEECKEMRDVYFNLPITMGLQYALQHSESLGVLDSSSLRTKYIIYTHSNVHVDFHGILEGDCQANVLKMNNIKSESQLSNEIESFYRHKSGSNLLIVQCEARDSKNLLHLKITIEQKERDWQSLQENDNKKVCIVVHVYRTDNNSPMNNVFYFDEEWILCTIENLHPPKQELKELVGHSVCRMIDSPFCPIQMCIIENLLWAFTRFKYKTTFTRDELLLLIHDIESSSTSLQCIQDRVVDLIKNDNDIDNEEFSPNNWQVTVACDNSSLLQGQTLEGAWKTFLSDKIKINLVKVVWCIERLAAWHSLLRNESNPELVSLWKQYFKKYAGNEYIEKCILRDTESVPMNTSRIPLLFPFSKCLYNDIRNVMMRFGDRTNDEIDINGVENLESFDEEELQHHLATFEPLIDQECRTFITDATETLEHWDVIAHDMVLCFIDTFVPSSDNWVRICRCFLGETATHFNGPLSTRLTYLFLSLAIIEPHFETLSNFVKRYGNKVLPVIDMAVAKYMENPDNPITDFIVQSICEQLIPIDKQATTSFSMEEFIAEVPSLIAHSGRISAFPKEIHTLRVCNDILRNCPSIAPKVIKCIMDAMCGSTEGPGLLTDHNACPTQPKGEEVSNSAGCLDRLETYISFKYIIIHLKDQQDTHATYQQLWALYFRRCVDANPNSPLLFHLLHDLSELPDTSLRFVGPVLTTILNIQTKEFLFDCWKDGFVWQNVNKVIHEYCKTGPETNIQNLLCNIFQCEIEDIVKTTNTPIESYCTDLKEASNVWSSSTIKDSGMTYLISVSFGKYFVKTLVELIKAKQFKDKIGEFKLAEFEQCLMVPKIKHMFGFSSHLQVLMVKYLFEGTLRSLKEVIDGLCEDFLRMKDISWPSIDTVEYATGYKETEIQTEKDMLDAYTDKENLLSSWIMKCKTDVTKRKPFFHFLAQRFFWVQFHDASPDIDATVVSILDKYDKELSDYDRVLCSFLTRQQPFLHQTMQLSPQTSDREFYQSQVLYSIMLAATGLQTPSSDKYAITKMLLSPKDALNMTLPLLRHSDLQIGKAQTGMCSCKALTISKGIPSTCPLCGDIFKDKSQITIAAKDAGVTLTISRFIHLSAVLESPSEQIIQLLFQSIVLTAINLGFIEYEATAELYWIFKKRWNEIADSFSWNDRDACQFVKRVINAVCNVPASSLHQIQERICNIIREVMSSPAEHRGLGYASQEEKSTIMSAYLSENLTESITDILSAITVAPSVKALQQQVRLQAHVNPNIHPFMTLVFFWRKKLSLIPHILPLIDFITVLNQSVNHRLSRDECRTASMENFPERFHNYSQTKYESFQIAWNVIRKKASMFEEFFEKSFDQFKYYSGVTNIAEFVCEDQSHVVLRVIQILANWQNAFLDNAAICALNGCKNLKFLVEHNAVKIQFIKQYQIKASHIIYYEGLDDMIDYGQNNAIPGYGKEIIFDLDAVELDLASKIILGRNYIRHEDFNIPTYKNEILSSNVLFFDVESKVEQIELPEEIVTDLNEIGKDGEECILTLREVLEVAMPLVAKIGGSKQETILNFMNRWKMNRSHIKSERLIKLLEKDLKLCHLVALFELVEDRLSVSVVKSLGDEYACECTYDQKRALDEFVSTQHVPNERLSLIIRRFAIRYIWNKSTLQLAGAQKNKLCFVLSSAGLWSEQGKQAQEERTCLREKLPSSLHVKHIRTVWDLVEERIVSEVKAKEVAKTRKSMQTKPKGRRIRQSKSRV